MLWRNPAFTSAVVGALALGIGVNTVINQPVACPRTMDDIVKQSTARSDFNMLVLTIFAGCALLGVAIGLASAFGLTRIIASFLFGVTAQDPTVFIAVPLLLSAVALIGVWFPARRAARVDPAIALRAE